MKLTQFENPLSGKTDDLFNLSGMWSKILGVAVLFIVFAGGQNLAKIVSGKTGIDGSIDPIIKQPVATANQNTKRLV